MSGSSDKVNHPAHYGGPDSVFECIKVLKAWGLLDNFCVGNAVKYICRAGKKDGVDALEDLKKARWYLDYQIALILEQRPATNGSGGTSL